MALKKTTKKMLIFKGMWDDIGRWFIYSNRDLAGRYVTRVIDKNAEQTLMKCFHETFNDMVRTHLKLKQEIQTKWQTKE